MSVEVMTWVWKHSRSKGIDRLVLLAIADCACEDGGEAWPKVATLAAKTGTSEETVRRAVRRLVDLGELRVEAHSGGSAKRRFSSPRHRPNDYTVLVPWREDVESVTPQSEGSVPSNGLFSDPSDSGGHIEEPSEGQPSVEPFSLEATSSTPPDPARDLLADWWERQHPRPSQPYVACLGVVRNALRAGNTPADVAWALDRVPVVSGGAIDMALRRRRGIGSGGRETPGEIAARMIGAGR